MTIDMMVQTGWKNSRQYCLERASYKQGDITMNTIYDTIYLVHACGYLTKHEYEKIHNKGDYALRGDWLDDVVTTYTADQHDTAINELAKHYCSYEWNDGGDILIDEWVLVYAQHTDADDPEYFEDVDYSFAVEYPGYTFADSKKPAWDRD